MKKLDYIHNHLVPDSEVIERMPAGHVYSFLILKWGENDKVYMYDYEGANPYEEIRGDEITLKDVEEYVEWLNTPVRNPNGI